MFEKLMNMLGYIKSERIDEQFVFDQVAKMIGDPTDYAMSKKDETAFFKDLSRIDNARDFLKATMANDMRRHFSAPDEKSRDVVRGAFARTVYFMGGLKEVTTPNKVTKVDTVSKRYG